MKFLYLITVVLLAGLATAQAAPYQPMRDCGVNPGECAGRSGLINGGTRNIGQGGITARIKGWDILTNLCRGLGGSCGGSYGGRDIENRVKKIEAYKALQDEIRLKAAVNQARMNEARRRADEFAKALAVKKAADAGAGGSAQVDLDSGCSGVGQLVCRIRGCRWDSNSNRGLGQCVKD